jgi:hypothetical protein
MPFTRFINGLTDLLLIDETVMSQYKGFLLLNIWARLRLAVNHDRQPHTA